MNTCEDHDDSIVVYNGKNCPVCKKIAELDDTIFELESKLEEATQ